MSAPPPATPLRQPRKILGKLGIAAASGALALGGLEIAATLHLGQRFVRGAEVGNSWKSAGQRDATIGWRGKPGARTRIVDGVLDYTVALNSLGFRDVERSATKRPGVRRVLALGDSVTWGWGVGQTERFSDLLEERLGPDVEVLNMAMPGYGTDQHFWTLEQTGLAFDPDVVVLCFVLNDVPEAEGDQRYGMPKPRFVRDGADWKVSGRPVALPGSAASRWAKAAWGRWSARSALLTLATGRTLDVPEPTQPAAQDEVRYRQDMPQTPAPVKLAADKIASPQSVTFHALSMIRDTCAERGIGLLVTHVPHKHDQYLYEPRFPAPKPLGKRPFRSYVSKRLGQACSKLGVAFVPVDEAFLKVCRDGESLHVGDGHPNARGHGLIAGRLAPALGALLERQQPAADTR